MKNIFKLLIISFISLSFLVTTLFAQHIPGKERGDSAKRAKAQLEGNRIRTTIHNFGFTGRTGGQFPINVQTPYEWPKNTGKVYLALTAMFVGAEVTATDSTLIKIVDVPTFRNAPDGTSWNFEPTPGYFNDDRPERSIATSVDETTWPKSWPDRAEDVNDPGWKGSWNGLGGKNDFRADQEIFYRMSDDKYTRYQEQGLYYPDSTDLSRGGMGMIVDVRALAWSQVLVQDAVYILHKIKNDGTKKIPKLAVTAWHADFVGGNGDSQDDISEFDLIQDIGFSHDRDNRAPDFGNDPVGIVGQVFLETPGNSTDRIDNDGDGEENGPKVTTEMLAGEISGNLIDDNNNGLVDEDTTHIAFRDQIGVTYADGMDQNGNAEAGSPVVTQSMIDLVANDRWKRWPAISASDTIQNGKIHLIEVTQDQLGNAFADGIDNDNNGEDGSPTVTQAMIDAAATDAPYFRYVVPGSGVILYDVKTDDLGKMYADGIDNDDNGAVDENIDNGIDEMIDESRNNGIDDDGDWNPLKDDVGLDGVAGTGDEGENDGKPTSGARFGLPGEPNVDVTDVSETDQIGITNAQYEPAGSINFSSISDIEFWFKFMRPGHFFNPLVVVPGEYDLFISSGIFPIEPGQTEPFSVAVVLANGPVSDPGAAIRKKELLRKTVRVRETYENDYQFANAPFTPTLTAVPGNNRVTLSWDDVAESSFDNYIDAIGGIGRDFEGYKIYRSQDPAFQDIENITNGFGVPLFKTALAIFDLDDAYSGFDSSGVDGVHYNLGTNSGLRHVFVDSTAKNGFTYYYAVVSYDFGFPGGNIIPSESPIRLSLLPDGGVRLGQNVARVIPEAAAAGYVPATLGTILLEQGSTTGKVSYDIIDMNSIKEGHVYNITFEDTLKVANSSSQSDTLTTKNFTLTDSTSGVVLVDKSTHFSSKDEQPIIDGFQLNFTNEDRVEINTEKSGWNNAGIEGFIFEKFKFAGGLIGEERPNDYTIEFGNVGIGKSTIMNISSNVFPAVDVNFKIFNNSTGQDVKFGFVELDHTGGDGRLTAAGVSKDRVIFMEPNNNDSLVFTWWYYLTGNDSSGALRFPDTGDSTVIKLKKPFLSSDVFRFVASSAKINKEEAANQLDNIKVVPNPYVASARWETKNLFNSGRGPRSIHFTHLPAQCTIRIFTVSGELVKTIYHDNALNNGTENWDLLTRDNLGVAYGVYIYYVEAPGIGERTGKFAIIK